MTRLFFIALLAGCSPVTTQTLDGVDLSEPCQTGTAPGDCPPAFTLPGTEGDVALEDLLGNAPVVVLGTANW